MPWDPMRDLLIWQERLGRIITPAPPESWTPAIDVYETPETYVVIAEVPGLTREEVDLAVEEWRLTIRGHRTGDGLTRDMVHFHQVERGHGGFLRSFEFAEKIDIDGVSADLRDGVLTVKLPKGPLPPPRRIEVK